LEIVGHLDNCFYIAFEVFVQGPSIMKMFKMSISPHEGFAFINLVLYFCFMKNKKIKQKYDGTSLDDQLIVS